MLTKLTRVMTGKSATFVTLVGTMLLALIGLLDIQTGYELSFSIFYLLPIMFVTWFSRTRLGFVFCFLSAVVWMLADQSYSNRFIPVWNTGVRFGFFLLIAYLMRELKIHLVVERNRARIDGLTSLLNAETFRHLVQNRIELSARQERSLALGFVDVDNFKAVNDQLGHAEGDRVLKMVGQTLSECVRTSDLVGRMGGDEFAVLLSETELGARIVFDRIHEQLQLVAGAENWPIGFSMGVALFENAPESADNAIKVADKLMYRVKHQGKNGLLYEICS